MRTFLQNPAIQLIALFAIAGIILGLTVFFTARACLKLKTKGNSLAELAADGERVKARLERYTGILSDNQPEDSV